MGGDQLVLKRSKHSGRWWVHGRPDEVRLGEVEATIAATGETLYVEVVGPLRIQPGPDGEGEIARGAVRELPALPQQIADLNVRLDALVWRRRDPATAAMCSQVRARIAAGITDHEARRLTTALDAALRGSPRRPRRGSEDRGTVTAVTAPSQTGRRGERTL
jgi:hypothetical protein